MDAVVSLKFPAPNLPPVGHLMALMTGLTGACLLCKGIVHPDAPARSFIPKAGHLYAEAARIVCPLFAMMRQVVRSVSTRFPFLLCSCSTLVSLGSSFQRSAKDTACIGKTLISSLTTDLTCAELAGILRSILFFVRMADGKVDKLALGSLDMRDFKRRLEMLFHYECVVEQATMDLLIHVWQDGENMPGPAEEKWVLFVARLACAHHKPNRMLELLERYCTHPFSQMCFMSCLRHDHPVPFRVMRNLIHHAKHGGFDNWYIEGKFDYSFVVHSINAHAALELVEIIFSRIKPQDCASILKNSGLWSFLRRETTTGLFGSVAKNLLCKMDHRFADVEGYVRSLPEEEVQSAGKCGICLDCYRFPQLLHPCSHVICRECLDQWWKSSEAAHICPLCRTPTVDNFLDDVAEAIVTRIMKGKLKV